MRNDRAPRPYGELPPEPRRPWPLWMKLYLVLVALSVVAVIVLGVGVFVKS